MIMKSPSMRSAKMAASDTVARNSGALMREEVADGLDIGRAQRRACRLSASRNGGLEKSL
ncbi:hypothetical protein JCM10599A_05220 [Paraburkholderia kururiensis]